MAENLAINGSNFQFIDRIYEIETIAQSLTQLLNKKEIVQKPLIELNGIGGIGKTTILCELTRECQRRQLSFALVDFSLERDKAAQIHKSFISRIIKQIDIKNNSLEKLNSVLAFEHSNQLDIERCFLEYLQYNFDQN